MKPKYIILDDVDRPYRWNVCRLLRSGKYAYIQPHSWAAWAKKKRFSGERGVPMEAFGFEVIEQGKSVTFTMVRESTATYPDGSRRNWQGIERVGHSFTLEWS